MVGRSNKERIAALKEDLIAFPPAKLVDILVERAIHDEGLWRYLEARVKIEAVGTVVIDSFELGKQIIARVYGDQTLHPRDASYHLPELYDAQSIVEQIFENGQYQQVIDLFDWSLQFEENLSEPSEPDDFLYTAYMPLVILCLKSHIRLGKTPAVVAEIFTKLGDADEFGLFDSLPILDPKDQADLAPVKEILKRR